jgi:flagellar biosynthesis/type III secretory pathway protein FliH
LEKEKKATGHADPLLAVTAEQAMQKIKELCAKAFRDGYTEGFKKGFEQGAMADAGKSPKANLIIRPS